jgi:hypothetical protein
VGPGATLRPIVMKRITLWRRRVRSKTTDRVYITRKCMTETEPLAIDPMAVRIDWLFELRWVPETPEEVGASNPQAWKARLSVPRRQ